MTWRRRVGALLVLSVAAAAAAVAFVATRPDGRRPRFAKGPEAEAGPLPPLASITPAERPYSVVLIVVDTLRADHLSSFDYARPTSPNIDALAAQGIRFSQARSQAAWTTASVGSLMTSRYPTSLGIEEERAALPEDVTTLAESMREAGRATGAFVSHSFCSDEYNFDQGFETFNDDNVLGHTGVSSQAITDDAIAWLDAHGDKPYFLWVHYFDPHFAYVEHADHRFDGQTAYDGPVRSGLKFSELTQLSLTPRDVAELHRLYDSEIAHTDREIGRLLARVGPEPMVVFTADHGEEFLDHDRLGHSKTVYDELIHVPLVVRCPHWAPGVVDVPVANLDIFPTVLACLGAHGPADLAGRPLGPERPRLQTIFSQTAKRNGLVTAIHGTDKVILGRKAAERYDLALDPGEQRNLGTSGDDALLAELTAWRSALRAGAREAVTVELSTEEKAQLEALGYVGE